MSLYPVSFALLFLYFLTAAGEVSINCGSSGTSAALNGREWLGDVKPKFSTLLQIRGSSSTASTVIRKPISVDPVPYRTARISRSKFSYEFQVSPGQKIIRLHFYPTPYKGFEEFRDLFTVESGPFILLSYFSASLTADALGLNSFVKEFCLNVQENGRLSIGFSPSSLDAYAFINGIEILSVPASLSYFHGGDFGVQVVVQKSPVYVDYDTAPQIIHRLKIKQSLIPSPRDFDGIFPTWAIQKASKEKSNTWKIQLDVGFRYLIRLHFSELAFKNVESDDVIFKVLINEMIVYTNVDIAKERNDDNIPWYKDYMMMMRGNRKKDKRDLLISLRSYDELIDGHELLAGFEIFKLSNPINYLASPNPFPPLQDSPSLLSVLGRRNVIATTVITIVALVNIIVHKSRDIWEASSTEEENKPSARAEQFCRRFSFAEIRFATKKFDAGLLIGQGGFGRVYKGLIDKGENTIAAKRFKLISHQGSHEFLTEIETLSELRHVNIVSLIGYCNEHGEMIIIYDYMANGTLADHLYKLQRESKNYCCLTWKQRLDICIGVGRGLEYLHTGNGIIHCDVKSTNILLDENFVAKVSDFGLARPEDTSKLKSYTSTKVKATFGYFDPYYSQTHELTTKTDTYAFGVVLLEVLCGRPAVDSRVAKDRHILSKWAQDYIKIGEVDQIIASSLRDEISPDSLKTFVGVVERCLCDEPKNRLTMSQVVVQLESALEQQENKEQLDSAHEQCENKEQCESAHGQQEKKELLESAFEQQENKEQLEYAHQQQENKGQLESVHEHKNKKQLESALKQQENKEQEESAHEQHENKEQLKSALEQQERKEQLECALEQQKNKELMFRRTTGVSDGIHDCNDEINLSDNSKVVNAEPPSKSKDGRRAAVHKPLRIWPWKGFWNRIKSSKKNESLLCAICEDIGETGINLAKFDWDTIVAATNQFSTSNKIGKGGFGPVYKAVLPTGQLVAVKRLSKSSDDYDEVIGLQEFKNKILLLSNIRHRSIIKLLGYCIHREENLLVYEFMENRSLHDTLLDKERHSQQFDWLVRFKIIMGIARGLVYLHRDSVLRLIHRNINPKNILLDIEMNPKISGFSFAKTLEEYQSELENGGLCGTFGYMAPEYGNYEKISTKSDVYSFGIVTLEIISGRRALTHHQETILFLPKLAWKLWKEGKALDLVDESLGGEFPIEQALRCIQIGLLCIQELPDHRPAMPSVIKLLEGDEVITQEPREQWS